MAESRKVNHPENDPEYVGLNVNKGIEQPEAVNADSVYRFLKKNKKTELTVEEYCEGILQGNRTILSRAITLIESNNPNHHHIAQEIIGRCLPFSGKSLRIGITGVPGAGKSTFIESFGSYLTSLGKKLAVLAIDPSSERSKGSILGDKTRMEELSSDPNAYIRPSPSSGSLGGVARKTRETILLCEAAGFDTLLIETVGVGQSETAVHSMVDFFLLLQIAGAGDELQGIKRGIMEMADAVVINKADGDNIHRAKTAAAQYRNALHLFPPSPSGWMPQVMTCSSLQKTEMNEIAECINKYFELVNENGYFKERRSSQARFWMFETIDAYLKNSFYQNDLVRFNLEKLEQVVAEEKVSPFVAAQDLLEKYFNAIGNR
ncbi:MAG: methylmalonyl Co-A mutase-associated GTPase MeaB [Prolixibacteraceae bacterium]|jgi:LAO/AO transport system kinase|nr:methylmalonyl Co-A mutase-associated GTPase MeaB [Prolixibacteraceae bacterium]